MGNESKDESVLELQEVPACLKHTALVERAFWNTFQAFGPVGKMLQEYKEVSERMCQMSGYVLTQQPSYNKKQGDLEVSASDLQRWVDKGPSELQRWLPNDLVQLVQDRFVSVCKAKLSAQFSAGLTTVGKLVSQCEKGDVEGFSEELKQKMVLQIPKSHPLKVLTWTFAEAGHIGSYKVKDFILLPPFSVHENVSQHVQFQGCDWPTRVG